LGVYSPATRRRVLIVSGAGALLLGVVATLLAVFPPRGRAAHSVGWFSGSDAPVWSPDGSLIAFTAFRGGHPGEIYVMRPDGTAQHDLTRDPAYDDLAAWSPDARKIAFTSNRDGDDEIYVMNADGSHQTRLTKTPGADYAPSWSPDGKRIAFWSTRDGNSEIYTMGADGSDQTRLTFDPAADESPTWGPDGRIAFVSNRGTGNRTVLYVMNADGSDQRQLTGSTVDWSESRPVWSPDGTKIAFVSSRDFPVDNTEIYEMNADGTGETRITHSPQRDDWPTWSPDELTLAFSHGTLLKPEIYRINTDGSGIQLLSRAGPVLETRFLDVPDPVAGARYTVTLGVRTGTGAAVAHGKTSCSAHVGTTRLRVVSSSFRASQARCAWLVPHSASGKWLYITIRAKAGTSVLTEGVRTRVP
jgi:Tol biopolymer transport system component